MKILIKLLGFLGFLIISGYLFGVYANDPQGEHVVSALFCNDGDAVSKVMFGIQRDGGPWITPGTGQTQRLDISPSSPCKSTSGWPDLVIPGEITSYTISYTPSKTQGPAPGDVGCFDPDATIPPWDGAIYTTEVHYTCNLPPSGPSPATGLSSNPSCPGNGTVTMQFSWMPGSGSQSYEAAYEDPAGSNSWFLLGKTTGNSVTVTNMLQNYSRPWSVRSYANADWTGASAVSAISSFNTGPCGGGGGGTPTADVTPGCSGTTSTMAWSYSRPNDGATWTYRLTSTGGYDSGDQTAGTSGGSTNLTVTGVSWTITLGSSNGGFQAGNTATAINCSGGGGGGGSCVLHVNYPVVPFEARYFSGPTNFGSQTSSSTTLNITGVATGNYSVDIYQPPGSPTAQERQGLSADCGGGGGSPTPTPVASPSPSTCLATAPSRPNLSAPPDDPAFTNPLSTPVTFSWTHDNQWGAICPGQTRNNHFKLQFTNVFNGAKRDVNVSSTTFSYLENSGFLQPGGHYKWEVKASNGPATRGSGERSFAIVGLPPDLTVDSILFENENIGFVPAYAPGKPVKLKEVRIKNLANTWVTGVDLYFFENLPQSPAPSCSALPAPSTSKLNIAVGPTGTADDTYVWDNPSPVWKWDALGAAGNYYAWAIACRAGDTNTVNDAKSKLYRVNVAAWFETVGGDAGSGAEISTSQPARVGKSRYHSDYLLVGNPLGAVLDSAVSRRWRVTNYSQPLVPAGGVYNYFADRFKAKATGGRCNLGDLQAGLDLNLCSNDVVLAGGSAPAGKHVVWFIDGNLTINGNFTVGTAADTTLTFIVSGNITMASGVGTIGGVYIAGGTFRSYDFATSTRQLEVQGAVYARVMDLKRALDTKSNDCFPAPKCNNEDEPAERIVFQPKYLLALNSLLGSPAISWREVAP